MGITMLDKKLESSSFDKDGYSDDLWKRFTRFILIYGGSISIMCYLLWYFSYGR